MRDTRNRRVYVDENGRFLSATYEQYCDETGIIISAKNYEDMEDAAKAAGYDMTAFVLRGGKWNLEPNPDMRTASERRREAYSKGYVDGTDWRIEWSGEQYACDELSELGILYAFRGETATADEISLLVKSKVSEIRATYNV